MTETSALMPNQELANKLGTQHPGKQLLILLRRIEDLEIKVSRPADITDPMTRSEKMKLAWARRRAKDQ